MKPYNNYYLYAFLLLFTLILIDLDKVQSANFRSGSLEEGIKQFATFLAEPITGSKRTDPSVREHEDQFEDQFEDTLEDFNDDDNLEAPYKHKELNSFSINTTGTVIASYQAVQCAQLRVAAQKTDLALYYARESCMQTYPPLQSILSSGELEYLIHLAKEKCAHTIIAAVQHMQQQQVSVVNSQWPNKQGSFWQQPFHFGPVQPVMQPIMQPMPLPLLPPSPSMAKQFYFYPLPQQQQQF